MVADYMCPCFLSITSAASGMRCCRGKVGLPLFHVFLLPHAGQTGERRGKKCHVRGCAGEIVT